MNVVNDKKLLRRIAELNRENRLLDTKNKRQSEQIDLLKAEIEQLKLVLKDIDASKIKVNENELRVRTATVLYASIQPAETIKGGEIPREALDQLDEIYFYLDEIIQQYDIIKVKTLGDAVLCAGGITGRNSTNPIDVVMAALLIKELLFEFQAKNNVHYWEIRLGIHTGSLTAIARGVKKKTYELKGDTVTVATRIESVASNNKVLVSVMTYELVKEFFNCTYYGKLPVKYMSDLDLFEIQGLLKNFTLDENSIKPNTDFYTHYGLVRFNDMQEEVLDLLEKKLPSNLYYHNVKHTVDVTTEVELIGWAEGVIPEQMLILITAGLFHDTGHTIAYQGHEFQSTCIAREILPRYGYTQQQIDEVCRLIMATQLPPKPNDLLEQIICDSDLDYLGRADFIPVSNMLYQELRERNMVGSEDDWNRKQIAFISAHQYFTSTAQHLREVNKKMQIERIRELLPKTND
jgi:class 3 adenylate cyclase/HD superfamily phosphodiesterase